MTKTTTSAAAREACRTERLSKATKGQLAQTIREMDRQCDDHAQRLQAMANGAEALLIGEGGDLSPWRRDAIVKLLKMVHSTAHDLAHTLTCEAEEVGCNCVEEVCHG